MKSFPNPNNLPLTSTLLLGSCITSFLLVTYKPSLIPWASRPTYLSTFLFLSFSVIIFKVTYSIILYPYFLSPLRHIPEPSGGSWWNGQYKYLLAEVSGDPQLEWHESIPNNGLIRYKGFLNEERLSPTTLEVLKEVLQGKCYIFHKPDGFRVGPGGIFGQKGLLFTEGEVHKIQRRRISPAFAVKQLQGMVPTFLAKGKELLETIEGEIDHEQNSGLSSTFIAMASSPGSLADGWTVIDMMPWLNKATLDIIGSTGFGYDFESLKGDNNEVAMAYKSIFSPGSDWERTLNIIASNLPQWLAAIIPSPRGKEIRSSISMIKGLSRRMVREKKEELELGGKIGEKDLLSLITKYSSFSEEEMQDHLMTFLAAGHETIASGLVWALYLLVLYPEVQSKLRQEILSTYPTLSSLSSTTYEKLDTLPYLRSVTLEVFRFFPPVPMASRVATEDTTLAGQFVPKGTKIVMSPWAINRSKRFWGPTADKFDPERWQNSNTVEDKNSTSDYSFLTFLHGPRSCIGKDFARLEFKCILAGLVGMFEFRPPNPDEEGGMKVTIKTNITSRPMEGMKLGIRRVKGW